MFVATTTKRLITIITFDTISIVFDLLSKIPDCFIFTMFIKLSSNYNPVKYPVDISFLGTK